MHRAKRRKLIDPLGVAVCDAPDRHRLAEWKVIQHGKEQHLCDEHHAALAEYYDTALDEPMPKVERL